jgi:hypothetical protein
VASVGDYVKLIKAHDLAPKGTTGPVINKPSENVSLIYSYQDEKYYEVPDLLLKTMLSEKQIGILINY